MEEIEELGVPYLMPNQLKVLDPFYKGFELILVEDRRFGNILKCKNKYTNEKVAIKILTIPQNQKNNGVPHGILNHVSILKMLNHPNIVRLQRVMETEDDVFLVFEYLDISLKRYLANPILYNIQNREKIFLRQALSGLAYCHIRKIVHRDLKPHNILASLEDLDVDLDVDVVKLSDFGVAKTIEPPLSPYSTIMGIPCYKAPELLMGSTNYSTAVDIWSMGCIFAEMIRLQPLFIGNDEPEILAEMFCLLGTPTEETLPGVSSICQFMEAFNPPIEPKGLAAEFPKLEPDGLDLLSKMLCLCPNGRISADQALEHPYLRP